MAVFTLLVGLAITTAVMAAMVPWLHGTIDRQRAQNAADAAALAGVTGGREASERLAARNDAVLIAWSREGRTVVATVRVGDRSASARATDEP
jgi:Flp pilus assembly protein TadG